MSSAQRDFLGDSLMVGVWKFCANTSKHEGGYDGGRFVAGSLSFIRAVWFGLLG